MSSPNLVIRGRQVALPDSTAPASIHVSGDTITSIESFDNVPAGCELIDVSDESIVMPGLVDSHVHINEPGRTEWEGFATATRAAAAGGVTTLVDMPLNSIPPTTTVAGLQEKLAAADGQCFVDVGFWGGVVPGNTSELAALFSAGVVGFKCFLIHSGVDEFSNVTEDDLRGAMPELTRLGAVLIVHAEVPGPISRTGIPACHSGAEGDSIAEQISRTGIPACHGGAEGDSIAEQISRTGIPACHGGAEGDSIAEQISRTGIPACHGGAEGDSIAEQISRTGIPACHGGAEGDSIPEQTDRNVCPTQYATFLASRPRAAENEAVELMIRLGREFGSRIHIVHHSSADALPMLREAKAEGIRITAETCPHYLTFAAEAIPDGATEFKCCPPIREGENREQLWSALANGTIDMIVSDHSPCPPDMKLRETGDFLAAWGGISSLQLRLPIIWTEARRRGFSIQDLARWLCSAPSKLVGLAQRKGAIAAGFDADFVIWNPEKQFKVEPGGLHHRHKLTPYNGRVLLGVVEKTFLRGRKIYDSGEFLDEPRGLLLKQTVNSK